MKTYTIVVTFPEALAKHAIQGTTVKAGNFGLALKRGMQMIQKRDGIKGRRLTKVNIVAVVVPEIKEGQP